MRQSLKNLTHTWKLTIVPRLSIPNQEVLTSIGFDLTLLDLAAQKSAELRLLYAEPTRDSHS